MPTFMKDDGQELTKHFKFSNDSSGALEFVKKLNSLIKSYGFTQLKVGIKSTSI